MAMSGAMHFIRSAMTPLEGDTVRGHDGTAIGEVIGTYVGHESHRFVVIRWSGGGKSDVSITRMTYNASADRWTYN